MFLSNMERVLIYLQLISGWCLFCLTAESPTNKNPNIKSNMTNRMEFALDQNSQSYVLQFNVSSGVPANVFPKDTDFKSFFSNKLHTAFNGTKGYDHIDIIQTKKDANSIITCVFKVFYKTNNVSLSELKSSLINTVLGKLNKLNSFHQGTVYHFKIDDEGFREIIRQGIASNRSKCNLVVPSCPREYICVDTPYFVCKHRCAHEKEKIVCKNGGKCFVDKITDTTKCSCPTSDSYVYTGRFCDEKVEKLKLESTYIIAIAAGGGGVIILILVAVIIIVCRRKKAAKKKTNDVDEDYELTPGVSGYDRTSFQNRNSKISLDGVSNGLYTGSVDMKFVGGRSHSVLKDDRGQEIYVYRPVSERPASVYSDTGASTPSRRSFHDIDYRDQRVEIERPHYRRDYY